MVPNQKMGGGGTVGSGKANKIIFLSLKPKIYENLKKKNSLLHSLTSNLQYADDAYEVTQKGGLDNAFLRGITGARGENYLGNSLEVGGKVKLISLTLLLLHHNDST